MGRLCRLCRTAPIMIEIKGRGIPGRLGRLSRLSRTAPIMIADYDRNSVAQVTHVACVAYVAYVAQL